MFHLKETYGDTVYVIDFPNNVSIPFRLLSLKEFNFCRTSLVLGNVPPNEVYSFIYRNCILHTHYREKPDDLPAGITDTLSKLIFHLSSPINTETLLDLLNVERTVARSVESQLKIQICRVFSGYTMAMLEDLTLPQLVKLFAEAETVLLDTGAIQKPFEIISKNESDNNKFSIENAVKEAKEYEKT